MSEMEQLKNLVAQIQSTDNNVRQQAETQLQQSAAQNPDLFCQIALSILQDSQTENKVKMSTIIMLKKLYVLGKNKPQLYLNMSNEARNTLRTSILVLLNNTEQKVIAEQISDFISDLAASLYNDTTSQLPQDQKWGDLVNNLFDLYKTNKVQSMVMALRIFENILDSTDDKLSMFAPQFLELYQNGFQNNSIDVQYRTMQMLLSMVMSFKPKDCKNFKPLIEQVLKLVLTFLESNNETYLQESISKLFDLCSQSPYFLKRRFNDLIHVMSKVRDIPDQTDSNTKIESVESLVNVLERYPELADNKQTLNSVVELIFKNMLEIEDEVCEDWMRPPEGFNDDLIEDDDQKIIKIQMDSIDRLLNILTAEVMVPFLKNYLEQMFSQNNWKMSHAAVMTISQIGEYLDEDQGQIAQFMNILQTQAKHQNPRLRYAVCQALGQFADDLAPDFQDSFHEQYFSIVLPMLDDQVPRVVAHCLASLTNFLEHSNPEQIEPHFQTLLSKIDYHLHNNISFVKEACLSSISALAEGSSQLFLPHYDQIMKLVFDILQNANKKEYKTLRGSAIECSTIIAKFFGKEKFKIYQDALVKEMIRIQNNEISNDEQDPQKQYLLSGWQRICLTLEQDLVPYLQQLMPSLLNMVSKSIESITKDAKGFRSSAHEEADIAIQLINIFLDYYGAQLSQYIPEIFKLINLINENLINPETKITALSCLPQLLKICKNQNQEYKSFGTQTFGLLWDLFINEKDSSFKSEYCYLMQEILKKTGDIFSQQELQQFLVNVENELKKSEERRAKVLENIDVEEEEKKNIEFNIKCEHGIEDDFRLEVANLFGRVFQSHGQKSLPLFNHLYTNHILPSYNDPSKLINLEYAIYLTDDAIEHLGQFLDQNVLQNFYQILIKLIHSDYTSIRQSSAFGLALLAPHLKQNLDNVYQDLAKQLLQMIEIPKKEKEQTYTYMASKENGIAAFGVIMQLQWNKLDQQTQYQYLQTFINYLPIQYDHKEGQKMHKLLMQLCQSNLSLVLGNNNENLPQLVKIFARIHKNKKLSCQEVDQQIVVIMKQLLQNQQTQQQINAMQLNEQQQKFVLSMNQ